MPKIANIVANAERALLRKQRVTMLAEEILCGVDRDFAEDMELMMAESNEPINIIIASNGGSVFEGLSIIRTIQKAQAKGIKVIGDVRGSAMSMAFLILQSCDERVMGHYCVLMCHGVTAFSVGDMRNIDAERKLLMKMQDDFSRMVAKRCVVAPYNTEKYWHSILADNTPQYYDSSEALKIGLIDRVEQ